MHKIQNITLIALLFITIGLSADDSLIGDWNFNNKNDLTAAAIGNPLQLYGEHKAVKGPAKGNGAVQIGCGSYYLADLKDAVPDGLSAYSIVMDVKIPVAGKWHSLVQTNQKNQNDGDFFISKQNQLGVGTIGYADKELAPDKWYRIAIAVNKNNRYDFYLNGKKVLKGKIPKKNDRFDIDSKLLFFADNNKEDQPIDVAEIKLFSRNLSDAEIKKLGGYDNDIKPPKPHVFEPYLQAPTANSIYICWSYPGKAPVVEYGETQQLGTTCKAETTEIKGAKSLLNINWFTAKLTHLKPSTVYYYKVKTDKKESEIYKFRTEPTDISEEHVRFVVYGDNRTNFKKFTEITDAVKEKLISLYGTELEKDVNLIFNVGDIVTNGHILTQYYPQYFKPISTLSNAIPFMISIGNHEGESPYFYKFMKYEEFGGSEGEKYYSFRIGRVLFVALNTNKMFQANKKMKINKKGEKEIQWLNNLLMKAENDDTIEWVFACSHHPGHSELWGTGNTPFVQKKVIPTLIKYSKVCMFAYGHSHCYERGTAPNSNMILMLNGGAGGALDSWKSDTCNYPEIQKTFDHYCYSIVDVDIANKSFQVITYSLGNKMKKLNNIEIDRFVIDKKNRQPPSRPSIIFPKNKKIEGLTELIASSYSGKYKIMSSQFQISTQKGDYTLPIIDISRDYEDIFGTTGKPDYKPVNLNKGINLEKSILKNNLDHKEVWVRVRYRDRNLQWSDWSPEKHFIIENYKVEKKAQKFEK